MKPFNDLFEWKPNAPLPDQRFRWVLVCQDTQTFVFYDALSDRFWCIDYRVGWWYQSKIGFFST
jgi:hypothetical protein